MITIEDIYKHIKYPTYLDKAFASILYLGTIGEKYVEEILLPYKISPPQFRLLRGLWKVYPDGISIYNMGQFLIDPKSDTSRLVTRLLKAGLVKRQKDKQDKRMKNVYLSKKGLRLLENIKSHTPVLGIEIGNYTPEQAKQLYELLQIMVDSFAQQQNKGRGKNN